MAGGGVALVQVPGGGGGWRWGGTCIYIAYISKFFSTVSLYDQQLKN